MDAMALGEPRRLNLDISNAYGAGTMSVLDFGNPDRPVDMIFAHANGFNALTYRTLLQPLSAGLRIWAPDLRGHGQTRMPLEMKRRRNWHDHRDDLVELIGHAEKPVALAGHSIGGVSSLLAAAEVPDKVTGLLLLDPVIWPPLTVGLFAMPLTRRIPQQVGIVKSTLRRRSLFDSREQAFDSWRGRGAFKAWPDSALADYVQSGLVETENGFELACSPQWEASNYASQGHNPWRAMRRYTGPVRIMKAGIGSLCAPRSDNVPRNVTVETVKQGGHLFPMTHPERVRDALYDLAV